MDVRLPDGTVLQNVPDGMSKADLTAKLKANGYDTSSLEPAAVNAGKQINSIPRQLGLTARYGMEGLAGAAQLVTEPLRYLTDKITGSTKSTPLSHQATKLADFIGLPSPEGANERVVGDATRLLAGSGGMLGAANAAARLPGMVGQAATSLAANPLQQLVSAAGAGAAGGASREAGGGAGMQTAAALLGGVGAGMGASLASTGLQMAKGVFNKLTPQQIDAQISTVLERAGVDYSQVPERVRQSMRSEMAGALQANREVSPAAVARLLDFKSVGATPTRGMVSQNPVQITREMNLAKMAANSSDDALHGLPLIQNQNNSTLIRNLNDAGANRGDSFRAGERAIGAIASQDDALARNVTSLYQQARDTSGRSANLDGASFTTRANAALDEAMVGGALPKDVADHMNRIARGEVPFTVDYAEQLKTRIGALQRATNDGSARMALGTVRRALDETPLLSSDKVNPGNLPAVPGTVPPSPSALGRESIDAFNQARSAARERFAWQESGRPVEAALGGAQPDKFVQQYVINGTLHDAQSIAQNAPISEVKNAILEHLKNKALNGAADEVGKFSQSSFNKALKDIGERKLALFFSPQEVATLQANGRVASYMQAQPVGSAVNNSNSGALLLGRGLDMLNKIPVVGPLAGPALKNINISLNQRQAQNFRPGLLATQAQQQMAQPFLLPAMAAGGLLSAPP